MNKELMFALSNADAVACREGEVRSIMHAELDDIADAVEYDKLGSIMFKSAGTEENPVHRPHGRGRLYGSLYFRYRHGSCDRRGRPA